VRGGHRLDLDDRVDGSLEGTPIRTLLGTEPPCQRLHFLSPAPGVVLDDRALLVVAESRRRRQPQELLAERRVLGQRVADGQHVRAAHVPGRAPIDLGQSSREIVALALQPRDLQIRASIVVVLAHRASIQR
jgi:hypothetical protein